MPSGKEERKNESSDLENEDKGITGRTAWATTANQFFLLVLFTTLWITSRTRFSSCYSLDAR